MVYWLAFQLLSGAAKLIDRFPSIVTFGAGLLGWIAGGLLVTDVVVIKHFGEPTALVHYSAAAIGAITIVLVGKFLAHRKNNSAPPVPLLIGGFFYLFLGDNYEKMEPITWCCITWSGGF